jgi:hypothetical protein
MPSRTRTAFRNFQLSKTPSNEGEARQYHDPIKRFCKLAHSRRRQGAAYRMSTLWGFLTDHLRGWCRTLVRRGFVQGSRLSRVAFLGLECGPIALGLTFLLIGMSAAWAQNAWQGPAGPGDWSFPANWSLGAPPTIAQSAVVNNGNTAVILNGVAARAAVLTIGPTLGSRVHLNGGDLRIGGTGNITIEPGGVLEATSSSTFGIDVGLIRNNGIMLDTGIGESSLTPLPLLRAPAD